MTDLIELLEYVWNQYPGLAAVYVITTSMLSLFGTAITLVAYFDPRTFGSGEWKTYCKRVALVPLWPLLPVAIVAYGAYLILKEGLASVANR